MSQKDKYGLIGRNIAYSFSRNYFAEKFKSLGIDATYENFDIADISQVTEILTIPGLKGLNVTIPYKETVIPFLDGLSDDAKKIGAVNTISFTNGKTVGYNTDWIGFSQSIRPLLKPNHRRALILGKGGAAKAAAYALERLGIDYDYVTRTPDDRLTFDTLSAKNLSDYLIVINTTPLGTSPQTELFPQLPYDAFTPEHLAFDLIYNPAETRFLKFAKDRGATVANGYEMLVKQAEAAWQIWAGNSGFEI